MHFLDNSLTRTNSSLKVEFVEGEERLKKNKKKKFILAAKEVELQHFKMIKYSVVVTLISSEFLHEYIDFLKGGHIQAVIKDGGARSAQIFILEADVIKVETMYFFPSNEQLMLYFNGPAVLLRKEMEDRFMNSHSEKIRAIERQIGQEVCSVRNDEDEL